VIPKWPEENREWRRLLLEKAEYDKKFQMELLAACAASPFFWINAFVWTHHVQEHFGGGRRRARVALQPFVTWKCQDKALATILDAFEHGGDVAIDKSRDMGASWLCLAIFDYMFLFRKDAVLMLFSRKEELVDTTGRKNPFVATGDSGSLMWKLDYIHEHLPLWMRPNISRQYLKIENHDLRSTIVGESTNSSAGAGKRAWAILLDEFARVPRGRDILSSTADTAPVRIFNSTPWGPGTAFTQVVQSGKAKVVVLGWWDHPEKGKGRRLIRTDDGKVKWTSPWYERECRERKDPREIAENLDISHEGSTGLCFDPAILHQHESRHVRPPDLVGDIAWHRDPFSKAAQEQFRRKHNVVFRETKGGPFRLWLELDPIGRPPQNDLYVVSLDLSTGVGASNSVMSVASWREKRKVAEFASPSLSPAQMAFVARAALSFFTTPEGAPVLIFERNGPGAAFWAQMREIGWPNVYRERDERSRSRKRTGAKLPGWHSSRESKLSAISRYAQALATDDIIIHCIESLHEARQYVYYDDGSCGPGYMRDITTGARDTHGDRVIADMLLVIGLAEFENIRQHRAIDPSRLVDRKALRRVRRKWRTPEDALSEWGYLDGEQD